MRISEKFEDLKGREEAALIAYISCGDPSAEETVKIASELIKGGVDILELGMPFSDPIADGPTIQAASQRALEKGMDTDKYFDVAGRITGVPKVCMTYYNLIYQYGLDKFCKRCADSGIGGLIVPDLPLEESDELMNACGANGIDLIFILSPVNSEERIEKIGKASKGFLYLQSVLGVTGAREKMEFKLKEVLDKAKKYSNVPIAVGFGVSKPDQVRALVKQGVDGIIVGSAIIKRIKDDRKGLEAYVISLKEATAK